MKFLATPLEGLLIIELDVINDERGFFARSWCKEEFARQGLSFEISQTHLSFNRKRATLRGMHYQAPPHAQPKVVSCVQGAIYDVLIDLRKESPSYKKWFGCQLNASSPKALFVPAGFAHGFQTLEDNSCVSYLISTPYVPEAGRGVRWDDPAFGIEWPLPPTAMAERDRQYPNLKSE